MFPMFVALVVVAFSGVTLGNPTMCLPPMGKTPFDETKFSGDWYMIGGIMSEQVPHTPTECVKATYSAQESGNITRITMRVLVQSDGKQMELTSTGQPLHSYTKSVTQTAWKTPKDTKWSAGVMMQSIWATDYTSFALLYACKPIYVDSVDMFGKIEVVKVMSRQPTMDPKLLEILKNILGGYGQDVSKMTINDNSKC